MDAAEYDWAKNAYGCWELAMAVLRERGVRAGVYTPKDAQEARQQAEGPIPESRYDAMGDSACG